MPVEPLEPGAQLSRSEDRRARYKIGERDAYWSGFALVYSAMDRHLMCWVRVKELAFAECVYRQRPDPLFRPNDKRGDEVYRKLMHRWEDEIHALSQVYHPSVARVMDAWRENGTTYAALEEHLGVTPLYAWQRPPGASGSTPWQGVQTLVEDYLDGLNALHAMQFVHGDVQPSTLAVTASGRGLIYDFGTARANFELRQSIGTMPWAREWSAPELVSPTSPVQIGPWSDLYGWALLVYGLTVGHPTKNRQPVPAHDRHMSGAYDDAAKNLADAGLPDEWVEAVTQCLSMDPEARPRSAAEVKERVSEVKEGVDVNWRQVAVEAQQTSEAVTARMRNLQTEMEQLKLRSANLEDNGQLLNEQLEALEKEKAKLKGQAGLLKVVLIAFGVVIAALIALLVI